ncbi:MAG TPA: hypothetical protein VF765_27210 [Polyangiaceae bacterium]
MRRAPVLVAAAAAIAVVAGVSAAVTSCSQTPVNVPVRTFQQATKMDVVCIHVNDQNGNPLQASALEPVDRDTCTIVAVGGNGAAQEYHLYAVVIQSTPGEVAAVDLTNGAVVDEDHAAPGTNFIPVGAVPTDIAVPRTGNMTFVSSADPNKPAIYAIDNRRVLGDSTGLNPRKPLTIVDLPACQLPQPPGALAIAQIDPERYVLLVQLRSWGNQPAQVVALDPGPLMRGAGIDGGATTDGGSTGVVPPGSLRPCTALGAVTLSGTLPASWTPAPPWPDGVPYASGGPPPMPVAEAGTDGGPAGMGDGGPGGQNDAGMQEVPEGGNVVIPDDAEPPPVPPGAQCIGTVNVPDGGIPLSPQLGAQGPSPSAMTMRIDRPLLYVADGALPLIHVIDVSDPTKPVEQPPLLATSLRAPGKPIGVGALAVSPSTRDGKVYLYATDTSDGTLMVFDVTDPASTVRTPLLRPHPELNPFQPLDRIAFSAPVASVIFIQHDWPLASQADTTHYYGGILCNPNPGAVPNINDSKTWAKGAFYRADQAGAIETNGTVEGFPSRLRGVFGFATLSNGNVVAIDVDDWDAPCRRPDPMIVGDGTRTGITGLLFVPQEAGPPDGGEYRAPNTFLPEAGTAAVTLESFFPVSAPNRLRTNFLLENDPNSGNHAPNLVAPPTLTDVTGASVQAGAQSPGTPLILPTMLPPGWLDPTTQQNPTQPDYMQRVQIMNACGTPGVRLSLDDPTAHIDQDWTVTFEGVLPGADQLVTDVSSSDQFQSLTLSTGTQPPNPSGPANGVGTPGYCSLGIEDWTLGQARAEQIEKNNPADAWTSDYIEITDDLLDPNDPYWGQVNDCWDPKSSASDRYNECSTRFGANGTDAGATGVGTLADTYLARDFPIIHAFDDHMVLGRFGWDPMKSPQEQTTTRVVVGPDPSNVPFLKIAKCCFHNQIGFKVRTGGEWVTVGQNGIGLLHHMRVAGNGACVPSCDPQDALLNGRLLDTPPVPPPMNSATCAPSTMGMGDAGACQTELNFDRNDPRAMRNPMFAFGMQAACGKVPDGAHTLTARDLQWHFSVRGGFDPLTLSITQGSNVAVSPQSMFFIEPLSRLAVIDGEQQGLVVFDLYTLQFAEGPFY